jgi:hypothetical protein
MKTLLARAVVLTALIAFAPRPADSAPRPDLPRRHLIEGVTNHKQLTGLHCGAASLEIVFDYWGPDVSQRETANAARTSSSGTYTYDIVRAGHFSGLSAAQGRFYPHDVPVAGYTTRSLGYAAFSHASPSFWLDDLKALVAQGYPVLMLMWFAPVEGSGGHYRVLVGYDDDRGEVYFVDPWERDNGRLENPDGLITWTYAELQIGWNYPEDASPHPYFGAVIAPWAVSLEVRGRAAAGSTVTVTAQISYPCPAPVDCSQFPAEGALAEIFLPPGMRLAGGAPAVSMGTLPAGNAVTLAWRVVLDANPAGSTLLVRGSGLVQGSVPEAYWAGDHVYYPAYRYVDRIGGEASLSF